MAASGTSFVSSCSWSAFVAVATTTRRPTQRRHQVAEALARAGAGLRQQVFLVGERTLDRRCQGQLLGPVLVVEENGSEAVERVHAEKARGGDLAESLV